MKKNISIRVKPPEAADEQLLKNILAGTAGVNPVAITGFNIIKRLVSVFYNLKYIEMKSIGK